MATLDKIDTKSSTQHLEQVGLANLKADPILLEDLDKIEETKVDSFIWLVTVSASLGGFLFGYDTGIISAILIYLHSDLGHFLDNSEKELITSITSGGAFIGAIAAGLTADRFGRKGPIYMGCVLFIAGAILQGTAFSLVQMTVGRAFVGLGVGSAAMIIPVSPAKYRGKLIGINNLSITGGQLLSYGLGAAFASVTHGWRWMVGIAVFPAILLIFTLPFCPESPRQLVFHNKPEEASQVLKKIFPTATPELIQNKIRHIIIHIEIAGELQQGKSKWFMFKQLFIVPANLRATLAACGVMALSQLSGFNNLMYYSSTLFAFIGFKKPVIVGMTIAAVNFLFTLVYIKIVDRCGRRRVLLSTVWGMALFLGLAAIAFYFNPVNTDLALSSDIKVDWSSYLILMSTLGMVVFYASGIGPLAWVSAEFFPMEVRSLGTMVMTLSNWAPNSLVSATFLTQMEKTTPTGTFAFYATICLIGWICIYFCYPEVKGMTLESIKDVFEDGFGVQRAREIQAEMRLKKYNQSDVATTVSTNV